MGLFRKTLSSVAGVSRLQHAIDKLLADIVRRSEQGLEECTVSFSQRDVGVTWSLDTATPVVVQAIQDTGHTVLGVESELTHVMLRVRPRPASRPSVFQAESPSAPSSFDRLSTAPAMGPPPPPHEGGEPGYIYVWVARYGPSSRAVTISDTDRESIVRQALMMERQGEMLLQLTWSGRPDELTTRSERVWTRRGGWSPPASEQRPFQPRHALFRDLAAGERFFSVDGPHEWEKIHLTGARRTDGSHAEIFIDPYEQLDGWTWFMPPDARLRQDRASSRVR